MEVAKAQTAFAKALACLIFTAFALVGCAAKTHQQVFVEPDASKATCASAALPGQFMVRWKDGTTSVEKAVDRDAFIKEVIEPKLDDIEYAEHDYVVKLDDPAETPPAGERDPASAYPDDWGQERIEATRAWEKGFLGQGLIVAVIDSGVDVTHPQLRPQLAINPYEIADNKVDDDKNGLIDDVSGFDFDQDSGLVRDGSGHGTHVAGVIMASHAHGVVKGIAPQAKLLPLDFMNDDGMGHISDAIRAMNYAASQGARIINASWGGAPCSKTLEQTISSLGDRGVLFVAAAGNTGESLDSKPVYPAAFGLSNQITVGASSIKDVMEGFSNFSYSLVHIMAPGGHILSTYPRKRTHTLSGTSMATPFVSGAAAVLWSARPEASAAQIKSAILKSAETGRYQVASKGRLNLARAMDLLQSELPQ